ncbi:MAG TPA: hypothetical protein VL689_05925 [Paraburkholderia sp.]|jgi:hypothetical protein|nr:hypothetical protein [Paraburkholderia sp.]
MSNSTSRTPDAAAARRLLVEATKLGHAVKPVLVEIASLVPQVDAILREAIATSSSDRTRAILSEAIDKHAEIINAAVRLSSHSSIVIDRHKKSKQDERLGKAFALVRNLDATKLEDAELVAQCKRAIQSLVEAPEVWAVQISSVNIPLYSLPFFHLNLLRAFLNRPSVLDSTFSSAVSLFKALAKDLAGEVVPFLGTIETIVQLATPAMERDIEHMRQATERLDRLFQFDDSLTNLTSHARYVESTIRLADEATTDYVARFERDAAWLIDALTAAARG